MAALKEYSPKRVLVSFDGRDISGYADGTFISVARAVPTFTLNVGSDGGGTRVRSGNRSGTVTITLRNAAARNGFLTDTMRDEEADPAIPHVAALQVKDFAGNTLHDCDKAYLQGFPQDDMGSDEGNREWVFMCLNLNMQPRGALDA